MILYSRIRQWSQVGCALVAGQLLAYYALCSLVVFRNTVIYTEGVPAGEDDYDGVAYGDLVFGDVDWSEVGDHDPARRSARKGTTEQNVHVEWATEACQDPRRWVRSAGSKSGMTVKVTGYSESAGFLVTAVVAPKDSPPRTSWWGASAWKANTKDMEQYREGG